MKNTQKLHNNLRRYVGEACMFVDRQRVELLSLFQKSCFNLKELTYKKSNTNPYRLKINLLTTLLTTGLMQVFAMTSAQQIDLKHQNATIKTIFKDIEKQTNYTFVYKEAEIKNVNKINISLANTNISTALNNVLKNSNLSYDIIDKTIIIKQNTKTETPSRDPQPSKTAVQQNFKITGTVVDSESGKSIIGATIIAQSGERTVTSIDGKFALTIKDSHQELTIRYIGYKAMQVKPSVTMNIQLVPENAGIEEVVVTGMMERKKETFTGASSTFTMEEIKQVGNTNVIQALKSLDPSFLMMENNLAGSNPNALATIELRGQTSIATDALKDEFSEDPNQPLFILDGFPSTLRTITDLDINRIASVTILKDAASTAIYGSRASNGVVVVETVKPKAGELLINYTADLNIDAPDLTSYNMMNAAEKVEFERLSGRYTIHPRLDQQETQIYLDQLYSERLQAIAKGIDSYWLSDPVQTAFTQRHSLMINGGEGSLSYGVGGDYRKNNGAMKGSFRDTWGTRLNVSYRHNKLWVSNMLYVNGYKAEESPYGSFSTWANTNPYYEKAPSDQAYLAIVKTGYSAAEQYIINPLYLANIGSFDRSINTAITNNTQVRWDINKNWIVKGALQVNKINTTSNIFKSPRHTDYRTTNILERGQLTNSEKDLLNYTLNADVTYSKVLAEKHILNGQLRAEIYNSNANSAGFTAEGFPTFSTGAARFAYGYKEGSRPQSSKVISRRNSFIGTLNYSYDRRYNADITYSYDGSTAFGIDNLYSPFFALGASWNLHQENFFKENLSVINLLRLRGNYGITGNQNFTSYTSVTTYDYETGYNYWGQGVNVNSLGNKNLEWQNTQTTSLGLDFGVWNSRFTGNINAYRKLTDPLVVAVALPASTALSQYPINAGNLTVNGLEATVKYSPIHRINDRVIWTLGFTGSSYKEEYNGFNNVLESLNTNLRNSKSLVQYRDGGDPNDIWTVPSLGIDPATGLELFMKKDGTYSFQYNSEDAIVVGNNRPTLQGVISSNLVYKGFSANINIRYIYNQDIFNSALYEKIENITMNELLNNNQDKRALYDRWKQIGDISAYKKIQLIDINNLNSNIDTNPESTPMSSRFVQRENRLALESISLSYDIRKAQWLENYRLSNLRFTGYLNDIAYFSTVKRERGIDYPYARTISFSISANIK